jgi:hypothetical protein
MNALIWLCLSLPWRLSDPQVSHSLAMSLKDLKRRYDLPQSLRPRPKHVRAVHSRGRLCLTCYYTRSKSAAEVRHNVECVRYNGVECVRYNGEVGA